jgi:ketosteroid isomerase-like protein
VQRDGEPSEWDTVAVFRIADGKIAECWVLPYDQYSFDEIWSPAFGPRA